MNQMYALRIISFISLMIPFSSFSNCEELFDKEAGKLNFGSWKNTELGINKDSREGYKRLSASNKKGRKDPGPTLTMHKQENGIKFMVLRAKDLSTKFTNRDLIYTNFDCTEINSISVSKDGLQFDLDTTYCGEMTNEHIQFENLKSKCSMLTLKKIKQRQRKFNSKAVTPQ